MAARTALRCALAVVLLQLLPGPAGAQPCPMEGLYGPTLTPFAGANQFSVTAADLDEDGLMDLLVSTNGLTIMKGLPPSQSPVQFAAPVTPAALPMPRDIVVEDFNNDGALDVAVASAVTGAGVYVFRGLTDASGNPLGTVSGPTFLQIGTSWGLAAADLDQDGHTDLVVGAHGQGVITLFGQPPSLDGSIVFQIGGAYATGGAAKGIALADLNGDGALDVAVANENETVGILPGLRASGQPTGAFGDFFTVVAGGKTYDVAADDLDGDGLVDIVSANYTGSSISVLVNHGSLSFTPMVYPAVGAPLGVELGDVNGDGVLDIVAAATGSGTTFTVLPGLGADGNGDPSFGSAVPYGVGNAYNLDLVDLDGDGSLDVAGANYTANVMSIVLNTCLIGADITLTVNVFGNGTVTIDPDLEIYPEGTQVTLTAYPELHHVFSNWGGAVTGTTNPVVVVMDRAKIVAATFVPERHPLEITIVGDGAGTVSRTPDEATYPYGTTVTLEALPELGSIFTGWSGDATGTENPLEVLIEGPTQITAEFLIDAEIIPAILAITDVPLDQGGKVKIRWRASAWDRTPGDPLAFVKKYFVWREVPSSAVAAARARADASPLHRTVEGDDEFYWEFVTSLPASAFPGYSYTAATPNDSTAAGNPYTRFLIQARNIDDTAWWDSAPDSGYSVDNLAPPTPLPFLAVYGPANTLHWTPSRAPDFLEFRLYRALTADFTPGPQTFLAATRDTGYVDAQGGIFHYKLVAIDVHGNPSGAALVSPDSPTAVLASLAAVETRPDRIVLRWHAPGHRGVAAVVERRTETGSWAALDTLSFGGTGHLRYEDDDVVEGERYGYRVAIFDAGEWVRAGETWASAVSPELAFLGAWPNPSTDGRLTVRFSLPDARGARIELFDVGGRRVLLHDAGRPGPGTHDVAIGGGRRVRPGVYLMRFTAGDLSRTQRIAIVR